MNARGEKDFFSFIGRKEKGKIGISNFSLEFLFAPFPYISFSFLYFHHTLLYNAFPATVRWGFFSSQLCSNIRKSWESRNISTTYYTRRNADHSVGRDQQNRPIEWIRFGGARNSGVGWRYPINQRNSKLPVTNFINRIEKDWHQPLCRNWQQMRVLRINNGTWI